MPSIVVKIEWDVPDDPNWLNPFNLEMLLAEHCTNTAFEVTEIEEKRRIHVHDIDEFYKD